MKRNLYASVAVAALLSAVTLPAAAQTRDWTGPYVGVFGGYGWGDEEGLEPPFGTAFTYNNVTGFTAGDFCGDRNTEQIVCGIDLDGPFVGGVFGFNFQDSNNIVVGIEADLAWADIDSGRYNLHPIQLRDGDEPRIPTDSHWFNDDIELMGSLRARLGIAMGAANNVLPYLTGGLAWARWTSDEEIDEPTSDQAYRSTSTYFGWTLGAGVEWAYSMSNWSVKGEYRYTDYGAAHRTGETSGTVKARDIALDAHIVVFGLNYTFTK